MISTISNRIRLSIKYFAYFIFSSNRKGHGIHSPFVFDFIIHVLRGKLSDAIKFGEIEKFRNSLIGSTGFITVEDLGAGSFLTSKTNRSISSIARYSLKSKKYARLLYRIVSYYKPDSIIELGTSFGITTQYLAIANPTASITTIEGSPAIAQIAQKGFEQNNFQHIQLVQGNFNAVLENVLFGMTGVKFFYVDGNHQYEPTLNYFNTIMKISGKDDILVFDDIHWSKDMEHAWNYIKQDQRVKYTIDLFFIGLVFLKTDFLEKQDFVVYF